MQLSKLLLTILGAVSTNPPDRWDKIARLDWWLIIPAVILLLWLLFLIAHAIRASGELWFWRKHDTWRCRLARLLTVLYIPLMGYGIGQLSKGLYGESGQIIWQADPTSARLVLVDDFDTQLHTLDGLEDSGCVGCHVYHEDTNRLVYTQGSLTGPVAVWDGKTSRPLGFNSSYYSFSPDGTKLVYALNDEDLYIYDFNSNENLPIDGAAQPEYLEIMPSWSADGNTIVFARSEAPFTGLDARKNLLTDLYYVPVEGGEPQRLPGASEQGVFEYFPAHAPNGQWLAFTRHQGESTYADSQSEIWLISPVGGVASRLNANNNPDGQARTGNSWPVWSSDSQWLAFGVKQGNGDYDIFAAQIAGDGSSSTAEPLAGAAQRGVFEHRPAWWSIPAARSLTEFLQGAALWLLPLIPLYLLLRLPCAVVEEEEIFEFIGTPAPKTAVPLVLPEKEGIEVLWKPQPALVIGIGNGARHVLTHFKRNLLDAGVGNIPSSVQMLCIVDGASRAASFAFAGVNLDSELITWRDSLEGMLENADSDAALREWVNVRYLRTQGDALNPQMGMKNQRVIGRMAVINNLRGNHTRTEVSLWERLVEAAEKARDNKGLTVILVSEIGDDVGSGAFADIAYLVRKLPEVMNLERLHVIGHLLTERAVTRNPESVQQLNAIAALRELSRFQISENAPFKMQYSAGSDVSLPQDGIHREPLFDELYVYDGESQPKPANSPATQGIYPALADSMAVWLDTAAKEANLAGFRSDNTRLSWQRQNEQHQLMVGSLGIYQYRLPFTLLLEAVTLQFGRELLQYLLVGQSGEPVLDYRLAKEQFLKSPASPKQLAEAFLAGKFCGTPANPAWAKLLQELTLKDEKQSKSLLRRLKGRARPDDLKMLSAWLEAALLLLLNGRATDNPDPVIQRGAKLGLTLQFLEALSSNEFQAGLLPQLTERIDQISEEADHPAAQTLKDLGKSIETITQNLNTTAKTLGATAAPDSLYALLGKRSTTLSGVWKELQQLQFRKTLTEIPVKDSAENRSIQSLWYENYLHPHLVEGLSQFYWEIEYGIPVLYVRVPGNYGDIAFNPEEVEFTAFIEQLTRLGHYFAEDIRKHERLENYLRDTELNPDHIKDTTRTLLENCNAFLSVNDADAPDRVHNLILSVNTNVKEAADLQTELGKQQQIVSVHRLKTSDPYSLSLVRTVDTVPIYAVKTVQMARGQYNSDEALVDPRKLGGLPLMTAVFEAEAVALSYERRLRDIQETRRLLNPVVVAGLSPRRQAEVYLLMAAAAQEWLIEETALRIASPELSLVLIPHLQPKYNPVMDGLLAFVQQVDDQTAEKIYTRYRRDDDVLEVLDAWELSMGQPWIDQFGRRGTPILKDLISITRLLIRALLE